MIKPLETRRQTLKKNGELFIESASISPIRNAEGIITHFVAVKEDVTERKIMEVEGLKFLNYIPHATYLVSFPEQYDPELLLKHSVRSVVRPNFLLLSTNRDDLSR